MAYEYFESEKLLEDFESQMESFNGLQHNNEENEGEQRRKEEELAMIII